MDTDILKTWEQCQAIAKGYNLSVKVASSIWVQDNHGRVIGSFQTTLETYAFLAGYRQAYMILNK
jgi:hypothetical protein